MKANSILKNIKWAFLSCIGLLICLVLASMTIMAAPSVTTTVNGTLQLKISDLQVSSITASTAVISWTTNGGSSSQVFYDTRAYTNTSEYAFRSSLNNAPLTQHSITLIRLLPNTIYHIRARSALNGTNFQAVSDDLSFETLSFHMAPGVSTLTGLPMFNKSATLWGLLSYKGTTSEVTVYFQWGKTSSYGSETHQQTVRHTPAVFRDMVGGLKANTVYHFRAVAEGDGISYGRDETFRTYLWPF
jgi:hypothetical protein